MHSVEQDAAARDVEALRRPASAWTLQLIVALVFAISIFGLGHALPHHMGFPLDDSWIHQTVGRNLAQFGSLGYLPHQHSSGSTSLLWTIILSANYKFLPAVSPIAYTLAVNSLCLIAIGLMLLRAALADGLRPLYALLWAAAPAFSGNLVWLAFTGMEHLLFIALSLSSILLWVALVRGAGGVGWGGYVGAGVSLGLVGMTRPEGAVLVALLLAAYPVLRRSRPIYLLTVVIAAGLAAIPFAINLVTSHSLLPLTVKGRRFLYFTANGTPMHLRLELLQQWVMRPAKTVAAVDGQNMHGRGVYLAILLLFALLTALVVLGLWSLVRERRWATSLICGWGILHSLLYMVILPSSGHGGRYQTFLLLLMLPLVVAGVLRLLRRWPTLAPSAAAVVLAGIGCLSLSLWSRVLISGIDHVNATHGVVGRWLNANLPGQPIAVFDIGLIGYERAIDPGNPPIMDLGGLTDASYLPYLVSRRVPEYLELHHLQYAVFPLDENGVSVFREELNMEGNPGVQRKILFRACGDDARRQLSWIETRNAAPCQEVDQLTYFH
jgi:hypothetical protein